MEPGSSRNVFNGHKAGPSSSAELSEQLWIDADERSDPLIHGKLATRDLPASDNLEVAGGTLTILRTLGRWSFRRPRKVVTTAYRP